MMELDLGGVLLPAAGAAEDDPTVQRLVAVLTQMQEGINLLTGFVAEQKTRIDGLELDVRRLKARTDAPKRPVILEGGTWRN
jgi:hypothetical protein